MRQLSGDAEGPGSFGSLPVNMFHANLVPPHSEKEVSADVMYFQPDGGFDRATSPPLPIKDQPLRNSTSIGVVDPRPQPSRLVYLEVLERG